MNDTISMFIDDELNIDEKINFVERVHGEDDFYSESIDLLEHEKMLRSDAVSFVPQVSLKEKQKIFSHRYFIRLLRAAELVAAAVLIFFAVFSFQPDVESGTVSRRFVLYQPEAGHVEIAGSFTGWKDIPMKMIGPSGYWEIELDISEGEHRYVFIVEEDKKIADPTIMMREKDDFGSENTVLLVEA